MNETNHDPDAALAALFARARAARPDTAAAEYAFETRLMARLRAQEEAGSIWAMVSWRLLPFFAVCVVGLTLWHSEVVAETSDAEQTAFVENLDSLDSSYGLN